MIFLWLFIIYICDSQINDDVRKRDYNKIRVVDESISLSNSFPKNQPRLEARRSHGVQAEHGENM